MVCAKLVVGGQLAFPDDAVALLEARRQIAHRLLSDIRIQLAFARGVDISRGDGRACQRAHFSASLPIRLWRRRSDSSSIAVTVSTIRISTAPTRSSE